MLSIFKGGVGTLGLALLVACGGSGSNPRCDSATAQGLVTDLIWQRAQQALTEAVPQADAVAAFQLTKAKLKPQLSGSVTMTKNEKDHLVTCEATLSAEVPQELSGFDWSKFPAAAGIRIDGKTVSTDSLQYVVQRSYDGQKETVRARSHEPFADTLAGLGLALFLKDSEAKQSIGPSLASGSSATATSPEAKLAIPDHDPVAAAQADYEAADKALNSAYQSARAGMTDSQKTGLRDEQRSWIKRRDETCSESRIEQESKGEIAGGQAMQLEILACKTKETAERAKQLRRGG